MPAEPGCVGCVRTQATWLAHGRRQTSLPVGTIQVEALFIEGVGGQQPGPPALVGAGVGLGLAGRLHGSGRVAPSGQGLQLAPGLFDDFSGTTLSSYWTSTPWVPGGGVVLAGSAASIAGTEILSAPTIPGAAVVAAAVSRSR